MPVQQISVAATGRETSSNGKSAPRSKLDKNEGGKAPGKSGSRSSNVSKASNSAKKPSQTPATPSTQDVEKDTSVKVQAPQKKQEATSVKVGPSTPQTPQKKQVKRHHRRKTSSSASADAGKQSPPPGVGSDHSPEKKVEKKRVVRTPGGRQLPTLAQDLEHSSSEDDGGEAWTEARSWSKEKARRGGGGQVKDKVRDEVIEVKDEVMDEVKDEAMDEVTMDQVMELQSVCSQKGSEEEEEKENRAPPENGQEEGEGGLKQRGRRAQRAAAEERESSHGADGEMEHGADGEREHGDDGERDHGDDGERDHGDDGEREQRVEGSSSAAAEEGEELITTRYQETGAGGGDMSAPAPQNDDHVHHPCSDDSEVEVCKICHCEGEEDYPLITPCHCTGSLRFVHQACLNQWIKSSDTRCCELCQYDFIMDTQLKPLRKWEKLQMSTSERRKIYCSVVFHLISIGCLLWSIYVLVKRTTDEIREGRNGILDWPFWTKLIVVSMGFTCGLIFMYIQCNVYLQLWRRLKAFNRIITVQNCPPRISTLSATLANGTVEVPLAPVHAPAPDTHTTDSEVEAALAPTQTTPV